MEAACLKHTQIPHTSKLLLTSCMAGSAFPAFIRSQRRPGNIRRSVGRRWWRRSEAERSWSSRAGDSGEAERRGGGDRAAGGAFSGPAYSVYKALTVKLARLLIEGTPAVPVFWLATEDHDFEEVSKVHLFDAAHQRVTLAAATPKDAGDSPVGPLAVDSYPVRELREALSGFPFRG